MYHPGESRKVPSGSDVEKRERLRQTMMGSQPKPATLPLAANKRQNTLPLSKKKQLIGLKK